MQVYFVMEKQRTLNRRESLALMLAGLSASALPAHAADALEMTSFEIGANRDPQLGAQVVIAVEKSFFKAEGLDLKIIWTQQSGDLQPLMAGGSINVATLGMHSIIPMRARRVPLRAVCALCEYSGTQGLVISPGKTLSGPADLVGKRIAVPNQSPHEMALVKLGKQYNFDAKKIILVRMEPSEAVVAAARGDSSRCAWSISLKQNEMLHAKRRRAPYRSSRPRARGSSPGRSMLESRLEIGAP
jgi:NitT/TauT family transport system substrate-binding protein